MTKIIGDMEMVEHPLENGNTMVHQKYVSGKQIICEHCKDSEADGTTKCNKTAYCLNQQKLSNCCQAGFEYPGWPDSDVCSQCKEHAGVEQ